MRANVKIDIGMTGVQGGLRRAMNCLLVVGRMKTRRAESLESLVTDGVLVWAATLVVVALFTI